MNYRKTCPICGRKLEVEDIDYNFEGCQDEMLTCAKCELVFEFKVRYGKVLKKYQYSRFYHNEWKEALLWKDILGLEKTLGVIGMVY